MNKKKNINKIILKTYEYLYKYNKINKFNPKRNDNLNHLYLLYIQNNYNFNFDFKKYTKNKKIISCLKSLYDYKPKNKNTNNKILFENDELLSKIVYIEKKKEFDIDKFLLKLEEKSFSLEYVESNIELLDYYGKSMNDTEILKCGFILLLFKEQFPELHVSKKLQKNIIKSLLKIIEPKKIISYINTQALLLLFLLKKEKYYKNLDSFITKLCDKQLSNGKWAHGYNSYFIRNGESLDTMHTCFVFIILLEYSTLKKKEEIINKKFNKKLTPSPSMNINYSSEESDNDTNDNDTN